MGGEWNDDEKKRTSRRGTCKYKPCGFMTKSTRMTMYKVDLCSLDTVPSQIEEDTNTCTFFSSSSSFALYSHKFTFPISLQRREQATSQLEFVTLLVHVRTLEMLINCVRKACKGAARVSHSILVSPLRTSKMTKRTRTLFKTNRKGNSRSWFTSINH